MKIDKESALHLAKVLANVQVSASSDSGLEHASAIELIKSELDEYILSGEDDSVQPLPMFGVEATIDPYDLVGLPAVGATVVSAGFGVTGEETQIEFDHNDDTDTVDLLIGKSADDPVFSDIVYVVRRGDELTLFQRGVTSDGYMPHVVSLVASDQKVDWCAEMPDGKILSVSR